MKANNPNLKNTKKQYMLWSGNALVLPSPR